jgi:hypothetical protein
VTSIPKGRRVGRAAVNALRDLLEQHDHVVQEIDGQNDFGEDLYVTFSEGSQVTGDVVKIQVKGGISWRRANGYAVPVGRHEATWSDGNVPVLCVVYDPETSGLYWANATDQLRRARLAGKSLRWIGISPNAKLDDQTLDGFVAAARQFVGRYRGMQAVRTHLGEVCGVEFDPSDYVQHFINEYGEDLIFWQRLGESHATLLHSDLDWDPYLITPDVLLFGEGSREGFANVPTVGDVVLNMPEAMWLAACFAATHWAREAEDDLENEEDDAPHAADEHGLIEADLLEGYVMEQIVDRLEVEPELMAHSVEELRTATDLDTTLLDELGTLESDPDVVNEAKSLSRTNIDRASPEALRLTILYLIDYVLVGAPTLPIEEQVRIRWRVPEADISLSG